MSMMDKILEESKTLKELLGGTGELIITSGGAEATTQVLMSHYFDEARLQGKNQFITEETFLEDFSCVVKPPEEPLAITPRTALVSLKLADSVTGLLRPIKEIAALCRDSQVALHVDVTEAIGSIEIAIDADFISFDGATLGIPGIGALLAKKPIRPLIYGTRQFNPALVTSFCKAALHAHKEQSLVAMESTRLRKRFEKRVREEIARAAVLHAEQPRLPHISYISFSHIHPNALLFRLKHRGVAVLEGPLGISFRFTATTTPEEIDDLVQIVKEETALLALIAEGL
jgi:cysteine desulfurase